MMGENNHVAALQWGKEARLQAPNQGITNVSY